MDTSSDLKSCFLNVNTPEVLNLSDRASFDLYLDGHLVTARNEDGYFSATHLCSIGEKKWTDWRKQVSNIKFLRTLKKRHPDVTLIYASRGTETFVHREIALQLILWLAPTQGPPKTDIEKQYKLLQEDYTYVMNGKIDMEKKFYELRAAADKYVAKLEQENTSLRKENEDITGEADATDRKCVEFEEHYNCINIEVKCLRDSEETLTASLEEKQDELQDKIDLFEQKTRETAEHEKTIEAMKDDVIELEYKNKKNEQKIKELEEQIVSLKQRLNESDDTSIPMIH